MTELQTTALVAQRSMAGMYFTGKLVMTSDVGVALKIVNYYAFGGE